MLEGDAAQFGRALKNRAEALGDADRGAVFGADKARETIDRKICEQPVAGRPAASVAKPWCQKGSSSE